MFTGFGLKRIDEKLTLYVIDAETFDCVYLYLY